MSQFEKVSLTYGIPFGSQLNTCRFCTKIECCDCREGSYHLAGFCGACECEYSEHCNTTMVQCKSCDGSYCEECFPHNYCFGPRCDAFICDVCCSGNCCLECGHSWCNYCLYNTSDHSYHYCRKCYEIYCKHCSKKEGTIGVHWCDSCEKRECDRCRANECLSGGNTCTTSVRNCATFGNGAEPKLEERKYRVKGGSRRLKGEIGYFISVMLS